MELLVSLEIEPPAGRPADAIEDRAVLESLPLSDWFTVPTVCWPLSRTAEGRASPVGAMNSSGYWASS